jgi:hypothetical protein
MDAATERPDVRRLLRSISYANSPWPTRVRSTPMAAVGRALGDRTSRNGAEPGDTPRHVTGLLNSENVTARHQAVQADIESRGLSIRGLVQAKRPRRSPAPVAPYATSHRSSSCRMASLPVADRPLHRAGQARRAIRAKRPYGRDSTRASRTNPARRGQPWSDPERPRAWLITRAVARASTDPATGGQGRGDSDMHRASSVWCRLAKQDCAPRLPPENPCRWATISDKQ